ncbi:MAG: HdeD family acid-resistance protein [Leptolyngbyaceae cyanobacterium bins.349]|nr:HdeD family acid-resistance protein [Leptolyngbyaceae cyanobacterium bins.349]
MTSDVPTTAPTSAKPTRNQSLIIGIVLAVLGVAGIALPAFSTIVVETWVSLILISAGATKVYYAFQTREQGGFIWKLLLGALYVATGIMLFARPLTGVITLTLLLGSFLLTEGVFNLILAFRLRPQQNWLYVLGDGIVTLALGAMIWAQWPFNAPWLIGTFVGASLIVSGFSRIMLSLNGGSTTNPSDPVASA